MKRSLSGISSLVFLLWIFLLPVHSTLSAQDFTVKTYTTKDGLSHNNIRAVVRDSTGFLWIATWDGLSRFDGHEFRNYYHVPNDSTSLPYFSIRNLVVDRNNDLWIQTEMGDLVKYNRNSDNFTSERKIGGIVLRPVLAIDTDNKGVLTFQSGSYIIKWNDKEGSSTIYTLLDKTGMKFEETYGDLRTSILFGGHKLWIGGMTVFLFKETGENTFTFERKYEMSDEIKIRIDFDFYAWYDMFISAKGTIWMFSNTGLFRLDEKSKVFVRQKPGIPAGEFTGRDFFCWGQLNDGIYIYDSKKSILKHINPTVTGFPMALLPEVENSLWFSSVSPSGVAQGLSNLVFTRGFFKNHLIIAPDSTNPAVYTVAMDSKRNILVGIRGYDHILSVQPGDIEKSIDKLTPDLQNSSGHIRAMSPVKNGIWLGYYLKLLQFYDYASKTFTNYFPQPGSNRTILPSDGQVYIATENISRFDPSTGRTETLWKSGFGGVIYKMYQDTGATLWCGMAKGRIVKFNTRTHEGKMIIIPPGQSNTEDIIMGNDGGLWLAFLGEGVCRYNPETGEAKYYTTRNGLSNNTTYNLLKDRSGNIWVSTNNGISRINPPTGQIRTFGLSDGLKIHEFNSGAKFKSDNGEFFFGGMGGYVRFYPDSLTSENSSGSKQKIILTSFEVSGIERLLPKSLNETDTIVLSPGENNFHLAFSTSDFINADKTRFRFRLSEVNRDWITTGIYNRNINYSNLKPGLHTLDLEANDIDGNWTTEKKVTIKVMPYFFQTKAFRILMPLFSIALILFLIFIYVRQIRNKEMQKQDALRLQTLQGQMNPHFIFNSLNSINYFISNNDKLSANRYIADFSKLIRSILYNMNNNFITLEKEIDSLRDYLKIEFLRFGDKFDYEIVVNPEIELFKYNVSPGLIQPFVENAIWHGVRGLEGRKGRITVKFGTRAGNNIVCIIEDDGIGRKNAEAVKSVYGEKKSQGISIAIDRLKIINKLMKSNYQITINDLFPDLGETGTRVEIELPLEKISL